MMHRCSSSSHVGTCSCGLYHTQSNSFSMLLSMSNGHRAFDGAGEIVYSSPNSSSSVDCTLSLGTPSTRNEKKRTSSFGWNILPSKVHCPMPSATKTHGGGNGGDPLLARRCANCDTTSTPLWRNGPRGPKSLCNACGIRFKKEERRATAATTTCNNGAAAYGAVEAEHVVMNTTWVQPQKMPCYASTYGSEFLFTEDDWIAVT